MTGRGDVRGAHAAPDPALNAPVLKTGVRESGPRVRISPPPLAGTGKSSARRAAPDTSAPSTTAQPKSLRVPSGAQPRRVRSHHRSHGTPALPIYARRRRDGWPLCPRCGEDELYSLATPATIETICGCYRCGWRPGDHFITSEAGPVHPRAPQATSGQHNTRIRQSASGLRWPRVATRGQRDIRLLYARGGQP